METKENNKYYLSLYRRYHERFGKYICAPFYACEFKAEDFIEEMEYSLETGIPFDQNSPRWRWEEIAPLPEGSVY